jgi:hypothetical protein
LYVTGLNDATVPAVYTGALYVAAVPPPETVPGENVGELYVIGLYDATVPGVDDGGLYEETLPGSYTEGSLGIPDPGP